MNIGTTKDKYCILKIFVLFFAFYFVLTRPSVSPLIYPDEAGYIGWAYKMINGTGSGLRYLPGYSVLIMPLIALGGTVTRYFPLITALNALLGGLFAASVYSLAEKIQLKHPLAAALAVGLYPALALGANFAMTECMVALNLVLLCIAVFHLSQNINSKKVWIAVFFLAGLLCITHSRCIAILPALVISLLPEVWKNGKKGIRLLFFGVVIAGFCMATALVVYLFMNTETVNAAHLAVQVRNLLTVDGILSFAGTLVAQLSYLVLSTYALLVFGIYYCIKMLKTHKTVALFMLLSFVFTAILSAVFMYHHENPAHILYGRYNEYTIYPCLAVGISGYIEHGRGKRFLGIGLALCIITAIVYGSALTGLDFNTTHTWGLHIYKLLFYKFSYIQYAVFVCIVCVCLYLIRNRKSAVVLLCGIYLVSLLFTEYDYFCKGASLRHETPQLVSFLEDTDEVRVDAKTENSMVYPWEYYNYTVYNPALKDSPDADLILSSEKLDETMIGAEKNSGLKLYSKTTDAGVDLSGKPEAEVKLSAHGNKLTAEFKNNGRPWLCLGAADGITEAVRAGLRVYKNEELVADLRCDFEDNVYVKASAEFDFSFDDGEYTVVAETVREFCFRGGESAYSLEKRNGGITLLPTSFEKEEGFDSFDPLAMPDISGFYRYYVTQDGAQINNILVEGKTLILRTYGEAMVLDVKVFADGRQLEFSGYEDGSYYYKLEGRAENLRIESESYVLNDNIFSFLTTESNFRPVDLFVRGMKKVFGIRLDHRPYGVDIKAIEIKN